MVAHAVTPGPELIPSQLRIRIRIRIGSATAYSGRRFALPLMLSDRLHESFAWHPLNPPKRREPSTSR